MNFALLLAAAQAAAPASAPSQRETAQVVATDYSLKPGERSGRLTPENCLRAAAEGEIVVCGRPDQYRVAELKRRPEWGEAGIPKLGMTLGPGATLAPKLEQVEMPGGQICKRIMATVKISF